MQTGFCRMRMNIKNGTIQLTTATTNRTCMLCIYVCIYVIKGRDAVPWRMRTVY